MSYYYENRKRAQFKNTEPTMTDQAGARDTDINIIVKKYAISGKVPGAEQAPISGDFTQLPDDLRGFIELATSLEERRKALPEQLANMDLAELMALKPGDLGHILKPTPAPTPVPTEEKK